jgi:hypothetical protein
VILGTVFNSKANEGTGNMSSHLKSKHCRKLGLEVNDEATTNVSFVSES